MKILLLILALGISHAEVKLPPEMKAKWNEFSTSVKENYSSAKTRADAAGLSELKASTPGRWVSAFVTGFWVRVKHRLNAGVVYLDHQLHSHVDIPAPQ